MFQFYLLPSLFSIFSLPQQTLLLKRLVSSPAFKSVTSHYVTMSHICIIYA